MRVYFHLLYRHTERVVIAHADCFIIIIDVKIDNKIIAATITITTIATRIEMDVAKIAGSMVYVVTT
jgi:hypothetical protein